MSANGEAMRAARWGERMGTPKFSGMCPVEGCGFEIRLWKRTGTLEITIRKRVQQHLRLHHLELGIRERSLLADAVVAQREAVNRRSGE
jgi:hypothetical protein